MVKGIATKGRNEGHGMDFAHDSRMGLGTDGMEWLRAALFHDFPQPPPWSRWTVLPPLPAQRRAEAELIAHAPLPSQQARQAMAPWANRLDLPGIGS